MTKSIINKEEDEIRDISKQEIKSNMECARRLISKHMLFFLKKKYWRTSPPEIIFHWLWCGSWSLHVFKSHGWFWWSTIVKNQWFNFLYKLKEGIHNREIYPKIRCFSLVRPSLGKVRSCPVVGPGHKWGLMRNTLS